MRQQRLRDLERQAQGRRRPCSACNNGVEVVSMRDAGAPEPPPAPPCPVCGLAPGVRLVVVFDPPPAA